MIKLLQPLPRKLIVACSGGIDSMVLVDFLRRKHDVTVAYFNHNTKHANEAMKFVLDYYEQQCLPVVYSGIQGYKQPRQSQEEFWREERYQFLDSLGGTVVTAHHLDDVVETWIWSSLHGTPKLLPSTRKNIVRPLLTTPKHRLESWALKYNVQHIEDTSNGDTKYTRNYIRHVMMPNVLRVNPGIHKMLKKKLLEREQLTTASD